MNVKQKIQTFLVGILVSTGVIVGVFGGTAYAANPIDVLIDQKCQRGSADASDRCAQKFRKDFGNKCDTFKGKTAQYRGCARQFANDNGATLSRENCWQSCEKKDPENKGNADGCGGVETAIIKCDQNNKGNDVENNAIWGLLLLVINILVAGIGVVAVFGLVYASILYATARDQAAQVTKAKETIFNVVLGLVVFALMWSFLQFLIPGGVFQI